VTVALWCSSRFRVARSSGPVSMYDINQLVNAFVDCLTTIVLLDNLEAYMCGTLSPPLMFQIQNIKLVSGVYRRLDTHRE
jgi:hypothetical protein